MSQFATATELRDFMEVTGTTGRKSTTNLNLLLQSASDYLERKTGRVITASASNTVRTFTSHGRAFVPIPDLRTITSVVQNSTTLTVDETYWLSASPQSPDIYTGLNLRAYNTGVDGWWKGNPEWFDRNLDHYLYPGNRGGGNSQPNDLVVTGLWGWTTTPPEWKHATLALASYYFHHADALFAGARATPEGNVLDLSALPAEVQSLIAAWSLFGGAVQL